MRAHVFFYSFTHNLKYLFEFKCIILKIFFSLTIKFYSYNISHTCFGKLAACKLPIACPRSLCVALTIPVSMLEICVFNVVFYVECYNISKNQFLVTCIFMSKINYCMSFTDE